MSDMVTWMELGDPRRRVQYPQDLMYIQTVTMNNDGTPNLVLHQGTLQTAPAPTQVELNHCFADTGTRPHCAEAKLILYRVRTFNNLQADIRSDSIYGVALEIVKTNEDLTFLSDYPIANANFHKRKYAYLNRMALELINLEIEQDRLADPMHDVQYPEDLMYIKDITMTPNGTPHFVLHEGTILTVPPVTEAELQHADEDANGPHCAEAKLIMYRVKRFNNIQPPIHPEYIAVLAMEIMEIVDHPRHFSDLPLTDSTFHKHKYAYLNRKALQIILQDEQLP